MIATANATTRGWTTRSSIPLTTLDAQAAKSAVALTSPGSLKANVRRVLHPTHDDLKQRAGPVKDLVLHGRSPDSRWHPAEYLRGSHSQVGRDAETDLRRTRRYSAATSVCDPTVVSPAGLPFMVATAGFQACGSSHGWAAAHGALRRRSPAP